ncbi:MAG: DEAD/DEAH box helicase, partial [Prosthecobacter sp.]|nr:DEAD/DEAH box helicase [Prosthecobacter sp.]
MTSSRHPEPKKKKTSLLGHLKAGLKKVIGMSGKKEKAKKHAPAASEPAHHIAKIHPHPRPPHEDKKAELRIEGESARPPRRDRERGPRSDRPERGERPERGGRGPRREDDEPRAPRQNFAAEPPPEAPPVPEGPFPEAFEVLGIAPAVLASVRESGYETPTTIQERAIPVVLNGKDVIGASQTGTGKTAAFALPTLTRLGAPGKFRCLVLEPTRELASQVVDQFEKYGKFTGLRTLLVHGGVGYEKQRKGLQQGVDVVVATPGRLLDFMQDGTADLKDVEVLILDEVDRMLDMGFLPDVRRIVDRTPKARQTLFFSATMPPQI